MVAVVLAMLSGPTSWWGGSQSGAALGDPIIGGGTPPPTGSIELHVQLSPLITHGAMERCIEFTFHEDCFVEPVVCSALVAFGSPPASGLGMATIEVGASCQVDIEQVFAVTAVDPLHTLRSVGELTRAGDTLTVAFEGDPENGGHWLVGGNLDAWDSATSPTNADTINILDFGVFVGQYLRTYPAGSADCSASGPNADINGDSVVDELDFAFIIGNFLAQSDSPVCFPMLTDPPRLTEISIADLIGSGLGSLAVADLNRDGWVDIDDMLLFRRKRLK